MYFLFILAFCDVPDLMMHLQTNYKYWKDQEEAAADNATHQANKEEEPA